MLLYKDEFEKLYQMHIKLPAVFIKQGDKLKSFISNKEIDSSKALQQLKDLVSLKLEMHDQHYHSNI
jgi:hypothetical protein